MTAREVLMDLTRNKFSGLWRSDLVGGEISMRLMLDIIIAIMEVLEVDDGEGG